MFSDFDGTLAPIVDDPETARPLEGVVDALEAVAQGVDRVGVISGRPASFLIQHLGGRGFSLWGLYGLEAVEEDAEGEPRVVPSPEAEEWRPVIDEVTERAEDELGETLGVERKGLSLTLHYRRAPGKADAAREWAEAAAESSGLIAHRAKMSYELRPPLSSDKGTVLEGAASGLERACFFGDDQGDLEAFDALDRLAGRGVTVLRVGVQSGEAPEELLDRADLVVDGPPGVLEVLRALAEG
ncbi:MAG: trehalose-phosphatase [Acidimicrobiales bacterium]